MLPGTTQSCANLSYSITRSHGGCLSQILGGSAGVEGSAAEGRSAESDRDMDRVPSTRRQLSHQCGLSLPRDHQA